MNLQDLRNQFGDYAKDIKLNLSSVLTEEGSAGLTQQQIHLIALASAYATKQADIIEAASNEVADHLNTEQIDAAKAAATIMAMNNIYYRAVHLLSDKAYRTMPANLRMQVMAKPGVDKIDFELMSLAVSAINGCGMCLDAHVHQLVKAGISQSGIQSTFRIAAVLHASAQVAVIPAP